MGGLKPSPTIFRAYDVRGVYEKDIDEEIAYGIGRAFGVMVSGNVIVGRDVRRSGEKLVNALADGLTDSGVDVLIGGICTTPACYFGGRFFKTAGGVMVTASHNPPEWNGFKMFLADGETVSQGAGMEKIREMVINQSYGPRSPTKGRVEKVDLNHYYVNHLVKKFPSFEGVKMAADMSDGSACLVYPRIADQLKIKAILLNDNPDGYFRGHSPEPTEENISALKKTVVEQGLDFGVAFDGDADRAVFVDDKGRTLEGDIALAVLLKALDRKGLVIYDVNSSTALKEVAERHGFQTLEWKVGRAFIHRKVRELGAVIGGEKSNHLYFGELAGDDDAIYASLKMAQIIYSSKKPLSKHVDEIPKYPTTPIMVFDCPDETKFEAVEKIAEELEALGMKVSRLDGVKAYSENGWILVRASNTMPQIKMSAEARDVESLKKLKELGERLIKQATTSRL
ncbi:MAG: phosphomannomutase/phosphoglucomutase [Candidatus Caldarchaeum sp.]|nr:phosphomannomutase/phosphoglucomutase [Candidatus Caldarchaeum sp.]MCS7133201.1 phosphomannomutase/phosphoglucomutase [Candidatus Caldarchaeum sp.]MCX8201109.1 phosphomannomutase/phosphoglucomutase [Candidatus Caldarchaeum sp.]MDW8434700.1 phosphomannomutase/phosphoglucomutase [Candidatus Caldarchaeum sp.]